MLKQLKTKNFRKLTDHTFDFGPGLQVIRAPNEAGKTTILEAISYAIGGVRALREPLDAVVTWGREVKTLDVKALWEFDGVDYRLKRSARGAELTWPGQRVVGQKEVTAKMGELLSADVPTMSRLNLATQGAIRGALEEGATKTMAMIEQLAGFDIVDYVIELIQTHRITGPTVTLEDRVKHADAAADAARAAWVPVDLREMTSAAEEAESQARALSGQLPDLRATADALKVEFYRSQHSLMAARTAAGRLRDVQERRQRAAMALQDALRRAAIRPAPEALAAAETAVSLAQSTQRDLAAYAAVQKLMKAFPREYWDGDMASLDAEIQVSQDALATARAAYRAAQTATQEAAAGIGHEPTTCPACNRAFDDAVQREEHNRLAQQRHVKAIEAMAEADQAIKAAEESLFLLRSTRRLAEPYENALRLYGGDVRSERNTVPPRITWLGSAPQPRDLAAAQRELAALRSAAMVADGAAGEARAVEAQIETLDNEIGTLGRTADELAALEVLVGDQEKAYEAANQAFQDTYAQQATTEAAARALRAGLERAQAEERRQAEAVRAAVSVREQAIAELEDLQRNNALLKAVRAARPVIADKLWSIVLSAVSSYFSAMRGEQSSVTRSDNEFLVDGRSIKGLSGSTLDLLGASIRLALTRTFLPNSSFLALDEPAAAMDEQRTQALLGFLVAAGFQQTLLVTHDELSETVAQNLITL